MGNASFEKRKHAGHSEADGKNGEEPNCLVEIAQSIAIGITIEFLLFRERHV